jgi:ribulose-5-phosphate 4-epimerase/fuculose-1-phosphate aldolase
MGQHTQLRELICRLAKSMFDRGLTSGSSGNISVRLADGGVLVTPTGTSFGHLDPAGLSLLDAGGPPDRWRSANKGNAVACSVL